MTMSKRMSTALDQSIAHWERLAAAKTPDEVEVEGVGAPYCALCKLYARTDDCGVCPVARSGHSGCEDTPYDLAEALAMDANISMGVFRRAARAEVKFLKSLRTDR